MPTGVAARRARAGIAGQHAVGRRVGLRPCEAVLVLLQKSDLASAEMGPPRPS
jgi:hypothetical protein